MKHIRQISKIPHRATDTTVISMVMAAVEDTMAEIMVDITVAVELITVEIIMVAITIMIDGTIIDHTMVEMFRLVLLLFAQAEGMVQWSLVVLDIVIAHILHDIVILVMSALHTTIEPSQLIVE